MPKKINLFTLCTISISIFLSGCASPQKQARQAAAVAPVPSISIQQPLKVSTAGRRFYPKGALFEPGVYVAARRFRRGTLYMDQDQSIQVDSRKPIGGIYWKDGLNSPDSYAFYESELVPTIIKTEDLGFIQK